jgi:exonuclease III
MKIATWNMGNREGAWDHLLTVVRPDYALLQETQWIEERAGDAVWEAIGENSLKYREGGRYRWGSAVWSLESELSEVPTDAHRGWVKAAHPADNHNILLVSIHVELDKQGRSIPNLHRILSDLTPLIEQRSRDVILGGDLNADVVFDERHGTRRHAIAFERIEELGFWHANWLIPPGHRQTFRPDHPVMDDHLFVSHSLMDRVVSCEVLANEDGPSDHFPVILELAEKSIR